MDIAGMARIVVPVAVGIGAAVVVERVLDGNASAALPAALAVGAASGGGATLLMGRFPGAALAGALGLGAGALLTACGAKSTSPQPAPTAGPAPSPTPAPRPAPTLAPSGIMPSLPEPEHGAFDATVARMPDGVQQRPDRVYIESSGDRQFLRFDSMVSNLGDGALQIARDNMPNNTTKMYQVLFNHDGSRQEVSMEGQFVQAQHPEHSHLHWEAFEKYELFRADDTGSPVEAVGDNKKASFYITNIRQVGETPPGGAVDFTQPAEKAAAGIETLQQGISAGWADIYGAGIAGQDIEITGLAPGRYILRQSFDPENRIAEKDELNNVLDTLVEITPAGTARIIDSVYPLAPGVAVPIPPGPTGGFGSH